MGTSKPVVVASMHETKADRRSRQRDRWRRSRYGAPLLVMLAVAAPQANAQRTAVTRPPAPSHAPTGQSVRPPLAGTLGPAAAAALGNPWGAMSPAAHTRSSTAGRSRGPGHYGVFPLRVYDAPLASRGGGALVLPSDGEATPYVPPSARWYPTLTPPQWHVVEDAERVQGWRVIDVEDVVCNGAGTCTTVSTRLKARWAPQLRSFAFADRVGRIWLVP